MHRQILNRLGELADLGYLAQRLAAGGRLKEALQATEQSLTISRRIGDVFGENITLVTQAQILFALEEKVPASCVMFLRDVAALRCCSAPDHKEATERLAQFQAQVGEEEYRKNLAAAEAIRAEAVARLTEGIEKF